MFSFQTVLIIVCMRSVCLAFSPVLCNFSHNNKLAWAIDCSSRNMTDIPKEALVRPVHSLILCRNRINSLSHLTAWPNLRVLDLSHNVIDNLTENVFRSYKNLLYLNLSYNSLHFISLEIFQSISRLETLDLSGNSDLGSFLSHNSEAIKIPLRQRLKRLYLNSIELEIIQEEVFQDSHSLEVLHLKSNKLKNLPALPKNLLELDISNNLFNILRGEPFKFCSNLQNLIIEDNINLWEIEYGFFKGPVNLKTLSLNGCIHLKALPKDMLKSAKSLKSLSIANCDFETVPLEFKYFFLYIDSLELGNNPWVCNASVKWFSHIKMKQNSSENFRCAAPWNSTVAEYFKVKLEHHILRYSLALITLLGFSCLVVSLIMGIRMERKRRTQSHPYLSLDGPPKMGSTIYISTVV